MSANLAVAAMGTYRSLMTARRSKLTEAVLAALAEWPMSDAELARRAGIHKPTFAKMRDGGGFGASERVAQRIVAALAEWREEVRETSRAVREREREIERELRRAEQSTRRQRKH